jgi:two-component system, NarL family, sensor histidine kinase UhpB
VSLQPAEADGLAPTSVNRRRAARAGRGPQAARAGMNRRHWGPQERKLRETLARDLHDRVAGVLATMLLDLRLYQQEERARGHEAFALDHLESQAREVLHSVREVVYELDGELLGRPLVASIAEHLTRNTSGDAGLAAHLEVAPEWPSEVSPDFARTALAIVAQAVANVRLHSGARAVTVRLGVELGEAVFEIEDDGVGLGIGPDSDGSIGLRSMKQRAWLAGGTLSVRRRGISGCVITARIPFGMTA